MKINNKQFLWGFGLFILGMFIFAVHMGKSLATGIGKVMQESAGSSHRDTFFGKAAQHIQNEMTETAAEVNTMTASETSVDTVREHDEIKAFVNK